MKKFSIARRLTAVLLGLVFCVSVMGAAMAAPGGPDGKTITLVEQNGGVAFTFSGDNDLFDDFKGVLPGDSLDQTITVAASGRNDYPYNIYLYARVCDKPGQDGHPAVIQPAEDFLDHLTIEVSRNGSVLGDGTNLGDGTGKSGVLLGEFHPGESLDLDVKLTVDIQMGNEFQNAAAYIDWVFFAEQTGTEDGYETPRPSPSGGGEETPPPTEDIPDEPVPEGPGETPPPADEGGEDIGDPDVPKGDQPPTEEEIVDDGVPMGDMPQTGDETGLFLWLALAALSGCGLIFLLVTGRKKEETKV